MVFIWYLHRRNNGGETNLQGAFLRTRNSRDLSQTHWPRGSKETEVFSSILCFPCSADNFPPVFLPISFFLYIFAFVWGCIIRLLHNNPLIISKIAKTKIYQKWEQKERLYLFWQRARPHTPVFHLSDEWLSLCSSCWWQQQAYGHNKQYTDSPWTRTIREEA